MTMCIRDPACSMSTWDDKPNDYEHALAMIEELRSALNEIAVMPDENDEWDGRDKYREARDIAEAAINKLSG